MANEVTMGFTMEFDDGDGFADDLSVAERLFTSAGSQCHKVKQTAAVAGEALNLGGIVAIGGFAIKNLDPTNYVDVKTAVAGLVIARLKPDTNGDGKGGFFVMTEAGTDMQTPYLLPNTADCNIAALIAEL